MQRASAIIVLLTTVLYGSCKQVPAAAEHVAIPVNTPANILKNMDSFLRYSNDHIKLSADFIALDPAAKRISKGDFLQQLSLGTFLPLRMTSKDTVRYQLYKIDTPVDDYIPTLLRSMGEHEYEHYQKEGKPLPAFSFVDLAGQTYTPETTKGKILVLKCWFIKCQLCVEEMPDLNKLVASYKDRKDILFVSLAPDKLDALREFLTKTTFDYAVVGNQEDYLGKTLNITRYPTHIVVDKKGNIVKEVDSYGEMKDILKKEASE